MRSIGVVRHSAREIPRHFSVSQVEGDLVIAEAYRPGLDDLEPGQQLVVLWEFHLSPPFTEEHLHQTPPHRDRPRGVFSTCSPVRPNPIGLSVVNVLAVADGVVRVRGLDMHDGTPIFDLKPHKSGGGQG